MAKKSVAVIFGGKSGEHEVSLVSATAIIGALEALGYRVIPVGITKEGRWIISGDPLNLLKSGREPEYDERVFLSPDPLTGGLVVMKNQGSGYVFDRIVRPDILFPVLHGSYGEDGSIQGLFELSEIPYVGCSVQPNACAMDKIIMKRLFSAAGLPVAPSADFTRSRWRREKETVIGLCELLGYDLFVKPANTGSSVGISKAHNRGELEAAVEEAARYDFRIQVERAVPYVREIEVAVLGSETPMVSVPGEVVPCNEFYDYHAKYEAGRSETLVPAPLDADRSERIREMALAGYRALGCDGMARVDFLLNDRTGEIFINEANTMPGFTSISMYPKLMEAAGVPYTKLMEELIDLALERRQLRRENETGAKLTSEWYTK